jgi:hypothetical protein
MTNFVFLPHTIRLRLAIAKVALVGLSTFPFALSVATSLAFAFAFPEPFALPISPSSCFPGRWCPFPHIVGPSFADGITAQVTQFPTPVAISLVGAWLVMAGQDGQDGMSRVLSN